MEARCRAVFFPGDEVHPAVVARLAHVTKGESSEERVIRGIVVAVEVIVDQHLGDRNECQQAEKLDQALLQHEVILNSHSIEQKGRVGVVLSLDFLSAFLRLIFILGYLLCLRLFQAKHTDIAISIEFVIKTHEITII